MKRIRIIDLAMAGLCLVALGAIGCGKDAEKQDAKPQDAEKQDGAEPDPLSLLQADLQALDAFDEAGARLYDKYRNNRFSEIFGGYGGKNLRAFIDERLTHFVRASDVATISPMVHTGWIQLPPPPNGGVAAANSGDSEGVSMAAANLGVQFWLQGLVDDTVFTVGLMNGQTIAATSSRVGLMLFGSAYTDPAIGPDGSKIPLPVAYRHGILIHEARHSDCSGGITEADLDWTRKANSYAEFFEGSDAQKCGHMHSLCLSGTYRGLAACDRGTWGAYGIQTVFLEAALLNAQKGTTDWQIINAVMMDTKSRLEYNYYDMIDSRTDNPDLTSSGLRR